MPALSYSPAPDGLGSLLRRHRRAGGRSQEQLAAELCAVAGLSTVSRHEVSRWEREERIPSLYWQRWLALVLGIDTVSLGLAAARSRADRNRPVTTPGRLGFGATHSRVGRNRPVTAPGRLVSAWPWRVLTVAVPGVVTGRTEPPPIDP